MAWLMEVLSLVGLNGILLFFIKRYFSKRDKAEAQEREERLQFYQKIETGLETIKLLSYHRMSQETERGYWRRVMPPLRNGRYCRRCMRITRPTAGMATWTPD